MGVEFHPHRASPAVRTADSAFPWFGSSGPFPKFPDSEPPESNTCSNKNNYRRLPRQQVKTACRGPSVRATVRRFMHFAYTFPMHPTLEEAINEWHESVNTADLPRCERAVGDPIVTLGPKGAGPITPTQFADWVTRSAITLRARSWHPISDRLMVVEQDARWPGDKAPSKVATLFRVSPGSGKVTAALRLPDLGSALDLAYLCRELAATEDRV